MKNILFYILVNLFCLPIYAQKEELSIDRIVEYSFQSPQMILAKIQFENARLSYENYRKSFLPSFGVTISPIGFNHSIRVLQNPMDGTYSHIEDYSNNSNAGISISQLVGYTGGKLNIGSNLNILSEISRKSNSFNTTPFMLGYSQNLFGGYPKYKTEKNIEENQLKKATKDYCSAITNVQSTCVNLFMDLLFAHLTKEALYKEIEISDTLEVASKLKSENGYITEDEYLQMKLQSNNSKIAYEEIQQQFLEAFQKMMSYLGINNTSVNNFQVKEPIFNLPLKLDNDFVIFQTKRNNPFELDQQLKRLEAEQNLYNNTLSNKFNANISLNYGLNQYANNIIDAYKNPSKQQSINLGLSIPIFQWGINENNQKLAKNKYRSTLIEIDNSERDFNNQISDKVANYNYNVKLYFLSKSSYELAQRQYKLLTERFGMGDVSVYELSSSNRELLSLIKKYYSSVREVWQQYYAIRNLTLFDFVSKKELTAEIMNSYKEK